MGFGSIFGPTGTSVASTEAAWSKASRALTSSMERSRVNCYSDDVGHQLEGINLITAPLDLALAVIETDVTPAATSHHDGHN
jgi:hypothetical protein